MHQWRLFAKSRLLQKLASTIIEGASLEVNMGGLLRSTVHHCTTPFISKAEETPDMLPWNLKHICSDISLDFNFNPILDHKNLSLEGSSDVLKKIL